MTGKYYISRNYRSRYDAAGKAKVDCETILEKNGWKNIGFNSSFYTNGLVGTLVSAIGLLWALIRLTPSSVVCLQYPFNKFYRLSAAGASFKRCRIITIVHDVYGLKKPKTNPSGEVALLSKSDVLIVHNNTMANWFRKQNVNAKLLTIDIFDYLHGQPLRKKDIAAHSQWELVFAGNMGGPKSFLYEMDTIENAPLKVNVYGVGFRPDCVKKPDASLLSYHGKFPSDEVIDVIEGDFGIVWYGHSLDTCDTESGQYLKSNNPHKLSMYLLCDLPIVIWDQAAMARFVTEQKIGITVSSLRELPARLAALSQQDIADMKANVRTVQQKLLEGEYLAVALQQALEAVE